MKVYSNFEDLPHRRGYGIVSLVDRKVLDSVMQSIEWSKVSFSSTNGAFNLRFDIIEKTIWSSLPNDVRKQQNPLQIALE
jgi:hypothetical protein